MKVPATVITLRDRPDRLLKFRSWWDEHPVPFVDQLHILVADRSERGGKYGAVQSQFSALSYAERIAPDSPSLHFEDDAIPTNNWFHEKRDEIFAEIELVMEADPDWAVIGLGGCPLAFTEGTNPLPPQASVKHIERVGFIETHAFLVSAKFRKFFLTNSDFTGHMDYRLASMTRLHSYLVWDELFEQDESLGTDNNSNLQYVVKLRKYFKMYHYAMGRRFSGGIPWRYGEAAVLFLTVLLYAHTNKKFFGVLACFLLVLHIGNCLVTDLSIHVRYHPFSVGPKELSVTRLP